MVGYGGRVFSFLRVSANFCLSCKWYSTCFVVERFLHLRCSGAVVLASGDGQFSRSVAVVCCPFTVLCYHWWAWRELITCLSICILECITQLALSLTPCLNNSQIIASSLPLILRGISCHQVFLSVTVKMAWQIKLIYGMEYSLTCSSLSLRNFK